MHQKTIQVYAENLFEGGKQYQFIYKWEYIYAWGFADDPLLIFPDISSRLPGDNQLTVVFFWHKRPVLIGTNQLKR